MLWLRQLLLIIWKGLTLKKRHFIVTIFELLVPMTLVCLMLYFKSVAGDEQTRTKERGRSYSEMPVTDAWLYKTECYYTPDSNLADMISQIAWNASTRPSGTNTRCLGVKNEDELFRRATKDNSRDVVGIVYENLNGQDELPDVLSYKIRMNDNFDTDSKVPAFSMGGPAYGDYVYTDFVQMQSSVDRAFLNLQLRSITTINETQPTIPKLYTNRMPYPDYYRTPFSLLWFLPMMISMGFAITLTVFVRRLVDEKANRAKELMRMMGLNDFTYFFGNWCNTFMILALVLTIAAILYKVPINGGQSVINKSDGFLVYVIFLLYSAQSVLFCMALSTVFNRPVIAAIATFIIWVLSYFLPAFLMDPISNDLAYKKISLGGKLATCLLPNAALHFACGKHIGFYEIYGDGSNWSNMNQPIADDNLCLSAIMGMMVAGCFIYSFIVWYVDNVWPWQFGIPKHPFFFFMPSYWVPKKMDKYDEIEEETHVDRNYFEAEPQGKKPGISISNLTKAFGWGRDHKVAVKNVSMNMYHGEITALLGHNGAGKTTTINVITGLFPPTSGTASVNGFDIRQNLKQARLSLGLCPQHNVLYDNLTVEEHLTFFAGLKGMPFSKMKQEVNTCIELLQLQNKRNDLARTLSGGMKRKLSLGIAFIGGSEVLVLDEPTSGMDPQARRAIWDLLQHIRPNRTIVLTTHYMEEADILGDRIAIMAEGVVQCSGSPLFLKRKFGAGYHLRVSKAPNFNEHLLTDVIQRSVPTAFVETDMRTEVSYILPVNESSPFIRMFETLEADKEKIGYSACGLTITTMEDVFIKVGQLAEKALDVNGELDHRNGHETAVDPTFYVRAESRLTGFPLWLQQVRGLLCKRFHDSRRYVFFIIFLIGLPVIIVILMLLTRNSVFAIGMDDVPPLKLELKSIFGNTKPLYGVYPALQEDWAKQLKEQLNTIYEQNGGTTTKTTNMTKSVLDRATSKLVELKSTTLVGGFLSRRDRDDSPTATAWYSGEVYHAYPISVNLMDVAILRMATGNPNLNIRTTNAPLPYKRNVNISQVLVQQLMSRLIVACFFPLALSFLSASFVLFPIHERQTKSKLIQLMTGVDGLTFWLTHFVWDFAMHLVASCFILIPFVALDSLGAYRTGTGSLGAIFGLMIMYGWSAIPLSYLLSFISKKESTGFVVVTAINFITGLIASVAISVYRMISQMRQKGTEGADNIAWVLRFLPNFAMSWGAANVDDLATTRVFCDNLRDDIHNPENVAPGGSDLDCTLMVSLVSMSEKGCGRDLLFMFLSGLVFFIILALLETNLVRFWYRCRDKPANANNVSPDMLMMQLGVQIEDSDVAAERNRVTQIYQHVQMEQESLVACDLTKYFGTINAVDHVTFSVHHNECFGLLGVNGAGKTTTFSMLTGDMTIDQGTAFIGNCSVKDNLKDFQRQVGYCPQFDALLDRLTGREALYMFARLRGIRESEIPRIVKSYIQMMDLQKHADKSASKYSGGNRRKLSLAVSLIGSPPVVFLDEPTAGVDPASRRKIWTAFTQVQKFGGTSFILTTHSMEESEALCGRLVIMVNGQFRCLGPIQYLKSKFGQGYTIIVKLNKEQHMDPQAMHNFRQFFEHRFLGSVLKDIHQGMLHYHIVDYRYTWSQLFREMENAKHTFQLEDYLISDTTLEQIFLAFARTQRIVASP